MRLSESDRKELYYDEELRDLRVVDTQTIGMDSHGCNAVIVVFIREGKPNELFGFMARKSSEEVFFDDKEIYTLLAKQVTVTQYEPTNYPEWRW